MSNKIDIFDFLKQIDDNNIDYVRSLSDSDLKSIAPVVFTRWLSGCKNKEQLLLVNNILNNFIFSLDKDKKLLLYLMICCSKNRKSYKWFPKNSSINKNIKLEIISQYYNITYKDAKNYLDFLSIDEIKDMAIQLNFDKEKINKLK
jgi:hypothetical protein